MSHDWRARGVDRCLGGPDRKAKHKECSPINFFWLDIASLLCASFPRCSTAINFLFYMEMRQGFLHDRYQIKKLRPTDECAWT